jgi:hypothetical protein
LTNDTSGNIHATNRNILLSDIEIAMEDFRRPIEEFDSTSNPLWRFAQQSVRLMLCGPQRFHRQFLWTGSDTIPSTLSFASTFQRELDSQGKKAE